MQEPWVWPRRVRVISLRQLLIYFKSGYTTDSLAEWSKALASGASPQGRGFEPHSCHLCILFPICQFAKLQNNCRLAVICYLSGSCPQQSRSGLCDARQFSQFLTSHAFQHCCNSAIRKTRKPGKSTNRSALKCERIQTHSPNVLQFLCGH